jgi:hypothetical protein
VGITFMIERKILLLQNGKIIQPEKNLLATPFLEEWKHLTVKKIKEHSYKGLVGTIRFYVRSANFLKNKYEEVKIKVKNIHYKKLNIEEKKEANNFLKLISEYKQKIREIKHKIKEEENL